MINELGIDRSGNNNTFTVTNMTLAADQMVDSPTNNFCTFNAIDNQGVATFSEGNLKISQDISYAFWNGTFWVDKGKWYFEALCNAIGTDADGFRIGFSNIPCEDGTTSSANIAWTMAYLSDGKAWDGVTNFDDYASYGATDIVAMAIDLDAGTPTLKIYKNNSLLGTRNISAAFQDVLISPFIGDQGAGTIGGVMNFGQDSSFAGGKTAQGNQDSGGIGDFYYTPPSGYLALCTSNLPATIIPSEHFNAMLYTGTGSNQAVTGVGFQPDLLIVKNRETTGNNLVFDVLRGGDGTNLEGLRTDRETVASIQSDEMRSLDTDGFTTDTGGDTNGSGQGIVAWNWKANGSGSSNTNGSTNTTATSANTDAGFSISTYTGTGANATIGHGLSKAPEMILVKKRNDAGDWMVQANDDPTDYLRLNTTHASTDSDAAWNDTAPTATVFSVGTDGAVNNDTQTFVAYCFHSVDGYSKVGSYTGNGSTDGTFVYTGFKPEYVLIKRVNSAGQQAPIYDSARDTYNVAVTSLKSDDATIEQTNQGSLDFLSNGFKTRNAEGSTNTDGGIYIYLAFAETPFKYSNAR